MIKREIIKFFALYSSSGDAINDLADYYKVKRWVKKVIFLYAFFSVLALLTTIMSFSVQVQFDELQGLSYIFLPIMFLWTSWGYASLILHFKEVLKSVIKAGSTGYRVGEQFQTTHYEVRHEYANKYSVSSRTENKGCLFAFIAGGIRFLIWAFFCVYIAPFRVFKKIRNNIKNLKSYNPQ